MYCQSVALLDAAAISMHDQSPERSRKLFIEAGAYQQELLASSPYKTNRRFFDAQFCWALGHIGILYQMIRWFKLKEPNTQLFLETQGKISNPWFLQALGPYITILENLPEEMKTEAMYNAVYFGCPDGEHHIHYFMKVAERECKGFTVPLKTWSKKNVEDGFGIKTPFVAVQARNMAHDPKRNVTLDQVEEALKKYPGYDIVSTGLDEHPIQEKYKTVKVYATDPQWVSFLVSATCDQFIGSDSGAWVIPWAYGRPVELINDKSAAWIYE